MTRNNELLEQLVSGQPEAEPLRRLLRRELATRTGGCPEAARLRLHAEGLLAGADRETVRDHVQACPACLTALSREWDAAAPVRAAHRSPWTAAGRLLRAELPPQTQRAFCAHLDHCARCAWWVDLRRRITRSGAAVVLGGTVAVPRLTLLTALNRAYGMNFALGVVVLALGVHAARPLLPGAAGRVHVGPTKAMEAPGVTGTPGGQPLPALTPPGRGSVRAVPGGSASLIPAGAGAPPVATPGASGSGRRSLVLRMLVPDLHNRAELSATLEELERLELEPGAGRAPELYRHKERLYQALARLEPDPDEQEWCRNRAREARRRLQDLGAPSLRPTMPPGTRRPASPGSPSAEKEKTR